MPTQRSLKWFHSWYTPAHKYHMSTEDWLFIAVLSVASLWAFALGLFIGMIWGRFL